ncbi:hypothetical protein L596_021188 [Steinernema carpocapsae]|uniref:G-protein coupled receptors family 1 profile domain-containing protein n=1 Tax=Steinernema carpocapsae TaxID=34508 RepID=A0A4U5MW05_STECR|nr:hypothetical protein L596_021188 [Steinernema carpocapsae]
MSGLPHCRENQIVMSGGGRIQYLPNEHFYVGVFYLMFFVVAVIPQFFLFYTCIEKTSSVQSCYKLMTIVCVCDIVNLINCLLAAGIFNILQVQHCKMGIWIVRYGQFVMCKQTHFPAFLTLLNLVFWYAYCIANLILAINRLFLFLHQRIQNRLFRGYRSYLWGIVVMLYAAALCIFSPHPFYFYDPDAGVWYFFWLGEDQTNYFHVYNNMIKLGLVVVCYGAMLVLLRSHMQKTQNAVSVFEKKLSIQACLIAVACAAGNITYLVISYVPMGNSPITGTIGEFFWGLQHSAAGFVYITMNKSVQNNFFKFLGKLGCKDRKVHQISILSSNRQWDWI